MDPISKSEFKARALEILRAVEESGESVVITNRGKPTLEVRKLRGLEVNPLQRLRGTVIKYDEATSPVAENDWENA